MRRFRLIEHTADTGLVAYGDSLAEAFASAARGMFSIIADLRVVTQVETRTLRVEENGYEALLFAWLNELLYHFDVENLLLKRFVITEFDRDHLKAVCRGEKYDPSRHRLKTGVKSATYHMMCIDEAKGSVRVIFDI
jgi:SHS2 domain-containing protein